MEPVLSSVGFLCYLKERLSIFDPRGYDHTGEVTLHIRDRFIAFLLNKQIVRVRVFLCSAVLKDKNAVSIDDCSQSVCYNKDCAISESLTKRSLDEIVSL